MRLWEDPEQLERAQLLSDDQWLALTALVSDDRGYRVLLPLEPKGTVAVRPQDGEAWTVVARDGGRVAVAHTEVRRLQRAAGEALVDPGLPSMARRLGVSLEGLARVIDYDRAARIGVALDVALRDLEASGLVRHDGKRWRRP